MCLINYAFHSCQHTTYYGFHPCSRARMSRVLCVSNSTAHLNPPPTIHTPPPPTCSNPTHLPPTLATIPSPFAHTARAHSHPDDLVLTTSVSKLDFSAKSNEATGTSAIRGPFRSQYPYPQPVGFGTHGAFGLDELNSRFTIPPLPTARLQYYPRKVVSQVVGVGRLCRACAEEELEDEAERCFTLGQRAYMKERAERKARQKLLWGMVGDFKRHLGGKGRGEDGVGGLVFGEEWWEDGMTDMQGMAPGKDGEVLVGRQDEEMNGMVAKANGKVAEADGVAMKVNGLVAEASGLVAGVNRVIAETNADVLGRKEDVGQNEVVAGGGEDAVQSKGEWRKFFKSKKTEGTVEGGGVFSGFRQIDGRPNCWRWDGAQGNVDMDIASGANLNMEIPNTEIPNMEGPSIDFSYPDFSIEGVMQSDIPQQTTETEQTHQAIPKFARALNYGKPPTRRISDGGMIIGEGDSGFSISSTIADENIERRISDGNMMERERIAGFSHAYESMDLETGANEDADASMQEDMDEFARQFLGGSRGIDVSMETAIHRSVEWRGDDESMEVENRPEVELDSDYVMEDGDENEDEGSDYVQGESDSGSEYEPPGP
ncbi:hypothetical protein MMC30_000250 [Trapelia coarctata]|nr:hypothetical protein [Trapelia coarctata]